MPFSNYSNIEQVLREFEIIYQEADFIQPTPFHLSDYSREDLHTVMREGVVDCSEYAICENLIYPVLKEVWKVYSKDFILWSHRSLNYDEKLSGFPEYIIARRSPLGKVVFDQPYFLIVEAKQDKFDEGWGECLAEMIAAQKLNQDSTITIFGIVSNGKTWEFGKLESEHFIKNIAPQTIYNIDELFAAVNYIFKQCKLQLSNLIAI